MEVGGLAVCINLCVHLQNHSMLCALEGYLCYALVQPFGIQCFTDLGCICYKVPTLIRGIGTLVSLPRIVFKAQWSQNRCGQRNFCH